MENYLGEIRIFAADFAPDGWALCDGSLLQISVYSTLFTKLGTTYGGDGVSTFALPDLRSRIPVGAGEGQGLIPVGLGQAGGTEQIVLEPQNLPPHKHQMNAIAIAGTDTNPGSCMMAVSAVGFEAYVTDDGQAQLVPMHPSSISRFVGRNAPVSIVQPFTTINYIIALDGIYPPPPPSPHH